MWIWYIKSPLSPVFLSMVIGNPPTTLSLWLPGVQSTVDFTGGLLAECSLCSLGVVIDVSTFFHSHGWSDLVISRCFWVDENYKLEFSWICETRKKKWINCSGSQNKQRVHLVSCDDLLKFCRSCMPFFFLLFPIGLLIAFDLSTASVCRSSTYTLPSMKVEDGFGLLCTTQQYSLWFLCRL